MAYTKIPRTNIAGTIGAPIGKISGTIVSTGNKSLDKLEERLIQIREDTAQVRQRVYEIQSEAVLRAAELERTAIQKTNAVLSDAATNAYESFLGKITPGSKVRIDVDVTPGALALRQEARQLLDRTAVRVEQLLQENVKKCGTVIRTVDTTLGVVESSLNVVVKTATSLKTIIRTLRAPLAALRAAVVIIKAIPLPQRYLVVSFTILESDLLEMMEQIITQAEEEVRAIESILNMVEKTLTPIRDRISRIRATLSLLKISNITAGASPHDLDILNDAGLYDRNSGRSIFDVIQEGQESNSGWELYGNFDVDLTDSQIGDQIRDLNPGDYIHFSGYASGSYVEEYYKWQVDKPPYPKRHPESEGWSRYPERPSERLQDKDEKLWLLSQLQTGTGQVYGTETDDNIREIPPSEWDSLFSTIDQYKALQTGNYDPLTGYRNGYDILLLDENNFDQRPGILKPSSWNNLEDAALSKLRDLPLTPEFQSALEGLWHISVAEEAGTSTLTEDSVAYRAANGELYYLRIVEDDHSPRVAVRRYVQARDESGVVVLEGIKTFSLNRESLIEEMKIQLDQLTR